MNFSDFSWQTLALFGGVQAVLAALLGFLGKVWLTRILQTEKAKLDAMLQKSMYMQKVQFDTEFRVYSDLWKELCAVRESIFAVSFHRDQKQESEEASLDKKRQRFDTAVERLKTLTEINRPFYAASIAKQLFELIELANKEKERDGQARISHGGTISMIHAEGVRNLANMSQKSLAICESIRERLTGTIISL